MRYYDDEPDAAADRIPRGHPATAYIAEAARLIKAGYRCPCGCPAEPPLLDLARELWAQSLKGAR